MLRSLDHLVCRPCILRHTWIHRFWLKCPDHLPVHSRIPRHTDFHSTRLGSPDHAIYRPSTAQHILTHRKVLRSLDHLDPRPWILRHIFCHRYPWEFPYHLVSRSLLPQYISPGSSHHHSATTSFLPLQTSYKEYPYKGSLSHQPPKTDLPLTRNKDQQQIMIASS